MQNPKVSVVVTNISDAKRCVVCVEDVMAQDYQNFEVTIVEQGVSRPEIVELAKRFSGKVFCYFDSGKSSLSQIKNIGVGHATGEIIAFLDDTCRVPEDYLSQAVKVFAADPTLGALSPKIIQPREVFGASTEDPVGHVSSYGSVTSNYGSSMKCDVHIAHECSLFLKKAFSEVGGFDGLFRGDSTRSESDLSLRITARDYKIVFDPSVELIKPKVLAARVPKKPDKPEQYFDYFHNDFLFFLKNLKWLWAPVFFLSRVRVIFACMFSSSVPKLYTLALPFKAYWAGYKTFKLEQKTL